MTEYFEIRNAPKKEGGEVIAIWQKDEEKHYMIFGVKDVEYVSDLEENKKHVHKGDDERLIELELFHKIDEPQFSVLDNIMQIPHIISDNTLHHLGKLHWSHKWHDFLSGWAHIKAHGTVYAKVIDWFPLDDKEDNNVRSTPDSTGG